MDNDFPPVLCPGEQSWCWSSLAAARVLGRFQAGIEQSRQPVLLSLSSRAAIVPKQGSRREARPRGNAAQVKVNRGRRRDGRSSVNGARTRRKSGLRAEEASDADLQQRQRG